MNISIVSPFAIFRIILATLPSLACTAVDSLGEKSVSFPFPVVANTYGTQCGLNSGKLIAHRGGLTRFAKFEIGGFKISFETYELFKNRRYQSAFSVATYYPISAIGERHPDQLYVAGFDQRTGESVIEEINILPPSGALGSSMFTAETGFGETLPYHWPEVKVVGGVFIPPLERVQAMEVSRREIYRGKEFSGIAGLSIDPEGRFFLVQDSEAGDIYQLTQNGTIKEIISAVEHSNLGSAILRPAHQAGFYDRIYCFMQGADLSYVVLHDDGNDCLFDSAQVLTRDELMEAYPLEPYGPYQGVR